MKVSVKRRWSSGVGSAQHIFRGNLWRMEFISDIELFIPGDHCRDPGKLKKMLAYYKSDKVGSSYRVRGNFEELDWLVAKLSLDKRQTFGEIQHSVSVSKDVMDYIQQKCPENLQRIVGQRFAFDVQAGQSRSRSSLLVTFRPQRGSFNAADTARLDFVRQRFVTFYQRTLSDLEVMPFQLGPDRLMGLKKKFPHLLFRQENSRIVTVIGPFPHIAKFQDLLSDQFSSKAADKHRSGVPDGNSSPDRGKVDKEESCPICMEPIETRKTLRCQHSFCRPCLEQAFRHKPVCPICGQVYGVLRGVQPEGGTMEVSTKPSSLPGYEKHGTIIIRYYIPDGIQKEEHPNPGQPYEGASRTAYLPNSKEGREVLKLLRRAFDQRLIFTVGRSTTSGRNNMVTWNDVHHKTSTHGGPSHYGYPDPDYLSRVREELKAKGIE